MNSNIKYGLMMGVVLIAWTLAMFVTGLDTNYISVGRIFDYLVLAVPVVFTALAIASDIRSSPPGYTIRRGLKTGLPVNAVGQSMHLAFLIVYHRFINPGWLRYVLDFEKATMISAGMTPESISRRLEMIERTGTDANHIFSGVLIGILILGLALSFITTILLRPVLKHRQ